jgi:hypothetical protein
MLLAVLLRRSERQRRVEDNCCGMLLDQPWAEVHCVNQCVSFAQVFADKGRRCVIKLTLLAGDGIQEAMGRLHHSRSRDRYLIGQRANVAARLSIQLTPFLRREPKGNQLNQPVSADVSVLYEYWLRVDR